jgi:cytidyltransferase-like protein
MKYLVDMSATLIHHGHIRLLSYAFSLGEVIVALTTDDEILSHKGYIPELCFEQRKEILMGLSSVSDVIPSPWLITSEFLDNSGCHYLIHGSDNSNQIPAEKLILIPRTNGISSSILREKASKIYLSNSQ